MLNLRDRFEAFRLKKLIEYDKTHNEDKDGIHTIFPNKQAKEEFEKKIRKEFRQKE